mgnify:CR=1 FL=1|jgi:hypothetical protein
MQALIDIGFRCIGEWRQEGGFASARISEMGESQPALYAFSVDGELRYVGKTSRRLKDRIYNYQKGGPSQRTNIRIRGEIESELAAGRVVDIWAFAKEHSETIGDFVLNIPAALEDDIIRKLRPPWNGGTSRRTHSAVHESSEIRRRRFESNTRPERSSESSFTVKIGSTYYKQGFFNVPVDYSGLFGSDGALVSISASGSTQPMNARINRRVNKNNTPRIMGGTVLRDWMQDNIGLGNTLEVEVQVKEGNVTTIKLTKCCT